MSKTVLQIPMDTSLRKDAEKQALEQGFSSLQEAVRLFLKKLARGALGISFEEEEVVQLSPKAEKRYLKMKEDIESGKVKTKSFSDVASMMKYLSK